MTATLLPFRAPSSSSRPLPRRVAQQVERGGEQPGADGLAKRERFAHRVARSLGDPGRLLDSLELLRSAHERGVVTLTPSELDLLERSARAARRSLAQAGASSEATTETDGRPCA